MTLYVVKNKNRNIYIVKYKDDLEYSNDIGDAIVFNDGKEAINKICKATGIKKDVLTYEEYNEDDLIKV